jgi:hypothetical protein
VFLFLLLEVRFGYIIEEEAFFPYTQFLVLSCPLEMNGRGFCLIAAFLAEDERGIMTGELLAYRKFWGGCGRIMVGGSDKVCIR